MSAFTLVSTSNPGYNSQTELNSSREPITHKMQGTIDETLPPVIFQEIFKFLPIKENVITKRIILIEILNNTIAV